MAKKELSKHAENKWIVLALVAIAQFMVVLDVSIVNVALPSIETALNFSASNLQWVVTAYALTFGGFLLFGGRAADLFGRRKLFMGAVAVFGIASLLCGLAQNETMLILARAFQGLAAAFMSPAALSIVLTEFKEGKERNKALGVWSGVSAGGGAAGVLLGGILTQYLAWEWNFFVNVPIAILVVIAAARLLPHHQGEERKRGDLDLPGAVSATTGLMALVYGLSQAPEKGWGSTEVVSLLIASVALIAFFFYNESRARSPLVPLSIFRIRNLAGGNVTALTIAATLFSMFFFITLYVQGVLGYSPVKAGLSFLPITVFIGVTSAIVSNKVNKYGFKPFLVAGPLMLSIGLFWLSHLRVDGSYWVDVFPGLAIFATGMGLSFISMTLATTSGVPKHFSGLASGVLNTSQQVGGAIGLAILSVVYASAYKDEIASLMKSAQQGAQDPAALQAVAQVKGFHDALLVGAGLAFTAALVALFSVQNHKVKAEPGAALH